MEEAAVIQHFIDQFGTGISLGTIIYIVIMNLSILLTLIYAIRWQKNFGVYYTLIFVFIPLTALGDVLVSMAETAHEAMTGQTIVYLGGCFLIFFMTMAIFDLCNIRIPKWIKVMLLSCNIVVYLTILTNPYYHLFYTSISFEKTDYGTKFIREYGIFHTIFLILLVSYFAMAFFVILFSAFFKKNVSKSRIFLLLLMESYCLAEYFLRPLSKFSMNNTTSSFVFAQIVFLVIIRRISIFNIRDTAIDTITKHGEEGFISFDTRLRYIGYFGLADTVFPELKRIRVDKKAAKYPFFHEKILPMIESYIRQGSATDEFIEKDKHIYRMEVHTLYNGKKKSGYQIHITDDTWDRTQINMLDKFNDHLQEKVEEKTAHIREMHDNLILSVAMMVESRDNSTGGHIKRTSDVVHMLIHEMKKDNVFEIDDKFARDVIKAAPMHDLGKIAVPDAILQKPGRFTDEEYEKMKCHAAEGAKIVHEILKQTVDESFKRVAENVAHYHHERMDGSGYPDGLSGDQIPLEARIMAVADVYDALVSKRVYKESMSFEKADGIMMESFGKHFDERLAKYYLAARPRLEAYYAAEPD